MAEQDFKTTRNPGAEWRNESGDGPHSMTIGAPRRAHPTQNLFQANDPPEHGELDTQRVDTGTLDLTRPCRTLLVESIHPPSTHSTLAGPPARLASKPRLTAPRSVAESPQGPTRPQVHSRRHPPPGCAPTRPQSTHRTSREPTSRYTRRLAQHRTHGPQYSNDSKT